MTPISAHKYENDTGRCTSKSIDFVVVSPVFKL